MNHLTFQERLSDTKIPSFIRLLADKAIAKIKKGGSTLNAEPYAFWGLVKYSRAKVVKSGFYTFIRIENDLGFVDIQTLNA